jgi:hypothetical protein
MRLGIMQPYFFPHLAYFALIANTDEWVVFDITQYTPKSWMNRNRVLHPNHGWMYVTVPLKSSTRNMKIYEAQILDPVDAHRTVVGKLSHYRKSAPYFEPVLDVVDQAFSSLTDKSLVHLNVSGMRAVCAYLQLPFPGRIASEMNLMIPTVTHPGGWAPVISQALGAVHYVNPIGGQQLFDPSEFAAVGTSLSFLEMPPFVYKTPGYQFEPGLSILDVLMWNEPDVVVEAMNVARLVTE